jgi:hypothetical protein
VSNFLVEQGIRILRLMNIEKSVPRLVSGT